MEPPEMVPPVKRTLLCVRWVRRGGYQGFTHRTLGSVVFPPSQVRPRRSLAVVVLRRVGVGAALLRTSTRTNARKDRSMLGICDVYKYHWRDYMLEQPFYTCTKSHSCTSLPDLDLARRHPAACSMSV